MQRTMDIGQVSPRYTSLVENSDSLIRIRNLSEKRFKYVLNLSRECEVK